LRNVTVEYLRQKSEKEAELKRQELAIAERRLKLEEDRFQLEKKEREQQHELMMLLIKRLDK